MSWWSRFRNVVRPDPLHDELDDEQQFHIEARAAELEAAGLSHDAALARAAVQFGNRLALRDQSRDVKLLGWLDSVWRDLRLGARLLRKDAAVSSAAIVSLSLAIGACTAAFSLIDALILRQLPVRDPNRLVYLSRASNNADLRFTALFSYPLLDRIQQTVAPRAEVFSMSYQSLRQAILPDGGGVEEKLRTQFVSGNAFNALGVTAMIGRVLQPADDLTPGAHPVAVVSHAFWSRRLHADPHVVGSWIQLEQRSYQIVGVAQPGFSGAQPGVLTDVWIPNMMFNRESLQSSTWNWLQVWGRLAGNETPEAAQAIAQTAFANFEDDEFVGKDGRRAPGSRLEFRTAASGYSQVREDFARPLLILGAIIGLVLLIACSNVANLLLARGAARTREMALRASIGAGRGRLLQQILMESGVITLAATALGVLASRTAVPVIVGMLTTNENPVYLDVRLDWRVLAFVSALGCLTTVLFGIAPALRASAGGPGEIVALGQRGSTIRTGMARSLVTAQVAFSLMIVFVAALLMRSFDRLLAVDLGFKPERLVLLTVETRDRLGPQQARDVKRQLLERVQALPAVESASLSGWALFRGFSNGNNVGLPDGGRAQTFRLDVSSQFFQTMGTAVLDGREFQPTDSDATDPMPVMVNDVFVRKYFRGEPAVGQRLTSSRSGRPITYEVVGVVAGTRDGSVRGEMSPFLFTPIADPGATIQIRSMVDPRTLADRVRQELPQVHPSLRLVDVTLQTALIENTLLRERLLAVLSGFFAALGLVLAAVGLYGVLSYAVVRRTREIGIRLALGAQPAAVVKAVAGRVAIALIVGVALGLAGGVYFARFVQTILFGIEPVSPGSFGLPVVCLMTVSLLATWAPLRRAIRVDPAEALRTE
ncbi:MAG TPA: ABC transporter permease [Vicinamibacterales bacterium]|nr:ABC transporter permease [Vicinamibacterales bacterium]